jgi:hypothetical protein
VGIVGKPVDYLYLSAVNSAELEGLPDIVRLRG